MDRTSGACPKQKMQAYPSADVSIPSEQIILDRISNLSPTQFENLTFDCVKAVGLRNVVWRTPGADGGRDIEGVEYTRDLSGHDTVNRWYVECKLYSSSLSWPTVWNKISYADVQLADYLLIVTNSNPSPVCETKINEWNDSRRRPQIRTWRGYDLPRILRNFPHVAATHGLLDGSAEAQASIMPLMSLATNLAQASYAAAVFGSTEISALEAAAALNELLSRRLADLKAFNRPAFSSDNDSLADLEWLTAAGSPDLWEGPSTRAVLAFLKHATSSSLVDVNFEAGRALVTLGGQKLSISERAAFDLDTIAVWAGLQVIQEGDSLRLIKRWGDQN